MAKSGEFNEAERKLAHSCWQKYGLHILGVDGSSLVQEFDSTPETFDFNASVFAGHRQDPNAFGGRAVDLTSLANGVKPFQGREVASDALDREHRRKPINRVISKGDVGRLALFSLMVNDYATGLRQFRRGALALPELSGLATSVCSLVNPREWGVPRNIEPIRNDDMYQTLQAIMCNGQTIVKPGRR